MNTQFKEQQCNVAGLALSWIGYVGGVGYFSYRCHWVAAFVWVVGILMLRWGLFHFFPRVSRFLGYGRIVDKLSPTVTAHSSPRMAHVAVNFLQLFQLSILPHRPRPAGGLAKGDGLHLENV